MPSKSSRRLRRRFCSDLEPTRRFAYPRQVPSSVNRANVTKVMDLIRAGKKQRDIADQIGKSTTSVARCVAFARKRVANAQSDLAWLDHTLRTHVQVTIEHLKLEEAR